MAYGFQDDMVRAAEAGSQRLIDNRAKAWDLAESSARTAGMNQDTVTKKRVEDEATTTEATEARRLERENILKDKEMQRAWQHAQGGYEAAEKNDLNTFSEFYKKGYSEGKAKDIFDKDPMKMTLKEMQEEMDSVKQIGSYFQNTPENIGTMAVEKDKQTQQGVREQANETQAQGGRMDLQRLQNAGNLAVANVREKDSGVTPLSKRSSELINIAKVNGFGNKTNWIASSIPGISSSVQGMRPKDSPEIDIESDVELTNSMADYVYRATLAEFNRQGEAYKQGLTDTLPDINDIQDQIMADIVESGKLGTESGMLSDSNTWNPSANTTPVPPPVTDPAPAGVDQTIWDNMDAEDKKAWQ